MTDNVTPEEPAKKTRTRKAVSDQMTPQPRGSRKKTAADTSEAPAKAPRKRAAPKRQTVTETLPQPVVSQTIPAEPAEDILPTVFVEPEPALPAVVAGPSRDHLPEAVATLVRNLDRVTHADIISFGAPAQRQLQEISQRMLHDVKSKDAGAAGESLATMVRTLKGFEVKPNDLRSERTLWEKVMGRVTPIVAFKQKFETVQSHIDTLANGLERHLHKLNVDVQSLEGLYQATLDFYEQLAVYIEAGEAKIAEMNAHDIPQAHKAMEIADEDDKMIMAQAVRDLSSLRDTIERRVHDLKLTRQVAMQSLPSIRLVQENDKSLIDKISGTITNTIPLWEVQMAQAMTIQRSAEAAESLKAATDLTNDLLTKNAANLRQANAQIRTQTERGVFDIEAIKAANTNLIGTIEDGLRITDEGKARRQAAEKELQEMEKQLRDTLSRAKAIPAQA